MIMKNSINFQISPLEFQEINELINLSFDVWKKLILALFLMLKLLQCLSQDIHIKK